MTSVYKPVKIDEETWSIEGPAFLVPYLMRCGSLTAEIIASLFNIVHRKADADFVQAVSAREHDAYERGYGDGVRAGTMLAGGQDLSIGQLAAVVRQWKRADGGKAPAFDPIFCFLESRWILDVAKEDRVTM